MMAREAGGSGGLLARAVQLLARREHSRAELARKLAQRGRAGDTEAPDPSAISGLLDDLERQGLLSDQRFATQRARQRGQRYGDARVRRELQQSGIAAPLAVAAVNELPETELQRARAVWQRRFGQLPTSREERGRQGRFLQTRGFSMESIRRVLGGAADEG
ncbi:MAG: recombination regulator RecX [Burkholderiaceae bacterium]